MRRLAPLAILALGAAALMTASAQVRIEGKRQTVAIEVAARGVSITVRPARLDCDTDAAIVGCPQPTKPRRT